MASEFHGTVTMMLHGLTQAPFCSRSPGGSRLVPSSTARNGRGRGARPASRSGSEDNTASTASRDWFSPAARKVGTGLWRYGDVTVIDGLMVNGTARLIGWFAGVVRWLQSGFIYHYAFVMIIGVSVLLTYFVFFGGSLVR
jgi:NADH-quinone oxidoreductase subunit L